MFTRGSAISTSSKPGKEAANNIYPRGPLCVFKRLSTDKSTHSLGVVCDEAGTSCLRYLGGRGAAGRGEIKKPSGHSLTPAKRER